MNPKKMNPKKIYLSTTKIPVNKTVSNIIDCLIEIGCTGIAMDYTNDKRIKALYFKIIFLDKTIPYHLPCRTHELINTYKEMGKYISFDNAEMIAWRQVLYWIKAQLAFIGTRMVSVREVFLPYRQTDLEGTTLYEMIENKGIGMLEYKESN